MGDNGGSTLGPVAMKYQVPTIDTSLMFCPDTGRTYTLEEYEKIKNHNIVLAMKFQPAFGMIEFDAESEEDFQKQYAGWKLTESPGFRA